MTTVDFSSLARVATGDIERGLGTPSPTSQRTTTNAACAPELKEDNVQLRRLLHDIETAIIDRLFWHRPSRFAGLLGELRDQVAVHFTLLEAHGYFSNATNVSPELWSLAESLRAEHFPLYLEADHIAEYAESVAYRPRCHRIRHLAYRALAFCDQLHRHERRENDLIQRVYQHGWGVGR